MNTLNTPVELKIDNKTYVLNVERSKELGLLKEKEDFSVESGDVFLYYNKYIIPILFYNSITNTDEYKLFGLNNELCPYVDRPQDKERTIKYLKKIDAKKVGNLKTKSFDQIIQENEIKKIKNE